MDLKDVLFIVITPFDRSEYRNTFIDTLKIGFNNGDWRTIGVSKDKQERIGDNSYDKYLCIFIDQCDNNIAKILEKISNDNGKNKKILIWTHKTARSGCPAFQCNEVRNIINGDKLIDCYPFSHGESISEKIVNSIQNNVLGFQQQLQEILTDCVKKKSLTDIHSLRADILTPFIPFHLYYQIKGNREDDWKDILKSCCEEINKKDSDQDKSLKTKLGELLKLKTDLPKNMNKAQTTFDELKKYFTLNEPDCIKAEDCHTKIKEFADCLENVVNFIEFGDTAECR